PTAAQAEFRSNAGTWPRLGGLALILAGTLGLLLLFGFVTLRLLAAASLSLLLLLLAPAMVLAPAFGDGGRDLFRRWGVQLLGGIGAKLLFAFLLGVVLAVAGILSRLQPLGWWVQWLLASTMWWAAFLYRHRVLDLAYSSIGHERGQRRGLLRRASDAIAAP